MAWPNREFETGRGLRKTPLHDRLSARGACFGVKNGWERPNWFARQNDHAPHPAFGHPLPSSDEGRGQGEGSRLEISSHAEKPVTEYSFGRQNWFANHAAEHRAAREKVAIFDQTGFSKFTFKGRDAINVLQRLCGNDVDVAIGQAVYTGLFNERGGFESDLTLVRLARDEFYIVSGSAQAVRDFDWITRNIRRDEHADLVDVTGSFGVLGVMGPNSRALLKINIGSATARAARITYVGELGWELHAPMEQLALVYDTVMEAGKDLGAVDAGHYAINSLRLEKGYRAWGAELSPDDTPLEAGLAFAIEWTKRFIGREALLKQQETGVKRRLAIFILKDPEPMLWGGELIYRDGKPVGYTTSGAYGHTVGAAVAMGYVNNPAGVNADFIKSGRFEINVNGTHYPATPFLHAPYDPARKRIQA
ncbi:MAG: hypothetical protein DME19_01910 [Verrucomicrobia bacterium]|nr:MAG: hypothetical protein DME19_01910 [Verrucomicrobiota bacterium]